MDRRAFIAALGASALLPVASGCTLVPGSAPNAAAQAAGSGEFTVGMIPVAHFAMIHLAEEQGFFKEEGLTIKPQTVQNAASIVPSVLNGQLGIGTGSGTPFINAVARNVPISIAAPAANNPGSPKTDSLGIVANSETNISSIHDLPGATVAMNAIGSQPHIAMTKLMLDEGLDPESLHIVPMPMPDAIAAVKQGHVDAAAVAEPFVTIAKEQGLRHVSALYSLAFKGSGTESVYYAAEEVIEARPDEIAAFSRAVGRASAIANEDRKLANSILVKYLKMDAKTVSSMVMPEFSRTLTTDTLEGISSAMVETEFLLEPVDGERMVQG